MDDPVPIEGIIEGEPESLAAVCAAGGSAVIAYCAAVGAQRAHVVETVVTALATFRRGVVENGDQEASQLERLLLSCTAAAARDVARVAPSPVQQAAAQVALESAVTRPLAPVLASRIIRALVDAAPVTALDGDAAAVRRASEQHYIRMFGGQAAAARAREPRATPVRPADGAWVPPELAALDADAANVGAVIPPSAHRRTGSAPPADTPAETRPQPTPPAAPQVAPQPGALVIKRGGHWPFRRPTRKPSHGGGGGAVARSRNALVAGVAGVALGAGIVAVAMPEEEVQRDPIVVRSLDTPFTVDGAVVTVARTNQAAWALAIRRRALRPGRTWLTLAVQTRNVSRPNFAPRSLGYRLRTASGIVLGPDTAQVPSSVTAARGRQAIGERSSVHLGFQVPSAQRDLTLEFDPSPGEARIRVPLN